MHLLDTHTFLWWDAQPNLLSARADSICRNANQAIVLSYASVWELQIKLSIGKLVMREALPQLLRRYVRYNRLRLLPIKLKHLFAIKRLPLLHRDPFDRL